MKVFDIKFGKLQALLLEKFMNQDPNKKGLSSDEFLNKYIAKDVKVTDVEIQRFIKERQIPKDQVNPEIRERIKQYLEVETKKLAVDKWIADKTKKTPVEVYIKKPQRPVFDVNTKGDIANKRLFYEFTDFGMDGMKCDKLGNLYVTRHGKGTIAILSPVGKLIREVQIKGKATSNITFGGPEGKSCFVTLQDRKCVEVFESEIAGRRY